MTGETGALNQGWVYQDWVDRAAAGLTLLAYYSQHYRHSTEQTWRDRILAGQILVEDCPASPQQILRSGQRLTYHRSPWVEPTVPLDFAVLYEDADLLVVAKPAGLPVMPAGGFLEHTLLRQLQKRYPQSSPVPIHRLGRGTSGLVLLARSPQARSHLTQQMRDRQIHKVYWALAVGNAPLDQFRIEQPIGKIPHPQLGHLYGVTPDGAFARSDCRVLRRDHDQMLVEVTILTGRPHQIRIHLAAAGFPLVGDPLYGVGGQPRLTPIAPEASRDPEAIALPGDCGYWLHAQTLVFRHPRTQAPIEVSCPAPSQFGQPAHR
ncbi:MAG: RluA family pseudouridine synthase [Limnothrix sp. BL-A-16]